MNSFFICHQNDLTVNQTRGFTIKTRQEKVEVFLIKTPQHIFAYKNNCPHLAIPLNWQPDVFLSADGSYIQCSTHGALFSIDDGLCVAGPCSGQSLQRVNIEIQNGEIWLQWDESTLTML